MSTSRPSKTVYILGAGFSIPAGGPSQARILEHILDLDDSLPMVLDYKTRLIEFMTQILCFSGDKDRLSKVPLEDIYTPIDRCLADGVALRGVPLQKLQELRNELEYLISQAIDYSFRLPPSWCDKQYAREFAEYLALEASSRRQPLSEKYKTQTAKNDTFSIISLNWDIMLDNMLYKALRRLDGGEDGDYKPIGVVDYCCYVSSLDGYERRIRPGLWALGSGGYNVKLLKIHGSMNWLQCSNCQRLYISFGQKAIIPHHINGLKCDHCKKHDHTALLRGSLIMPTFLKDLSNFQIKLVWQNAGVELMEATKLVFIGYSLPHADFEFRQLLSRMVHKAADIEVVLYEGTEEKERMQYAEEVNRYLEFFGNRSVTFHEKGAVKYIEALTGKATP